MNEELTSLWFQHFKMFCKFSRKYSDFNQLYTFEDLMSECFIILKSCFERYDKGKENAAQFSSYLFNALNRNLWGLVNGRTSREAGNLQLERSCAQLDAKNNDEDDSTLLDLIADVEEDYEEQLFIDDLRRAEIEAINKLTLKQRNVVQARNGFKSAYMTCEELAELFNISIQRVNQIEKDSYRKLRRDPALRKIYEQEYCTRKNDEFKLEKELQEKRAATKQNLKDLRKSLRLV